MSQTITKNMTIDEIAAYVDANSKSIFQNPIMINKIRETVYDSEIQEAKKISEAQAKRFAEIQEAKRIAEVKVNHSVKSKSTNRRYNKGGSDFRLNLPSFRNSTSPPNTPLNAEEPMQMQINENERRMLAHQQFMKQQLAHQQWQEWQQQQQWQQQMHWESQMQMHTNQHVQMQSPTQQQPKFVFMNNMMHIIN